ncbi:MAG: hypothetical protein ACPGJS_09595 [Flammeovirgaceae bacterium]
MKTIFWILMLFFFTSCQSKTTPVTHSLPLTGTWELISATTIQNDSISTKDNVGKRMIKIINDTHFSFLNHDVNQGTDSTASFVAGGGSYRLQGNAYTEYLEYCSFREWEGHSFTFTVEIKGDTLVQRGMEKIDELGVNREIIETYIRTKK